MGQGWRLTSLLGSRHSEDITYSSMVQVFGQSLLTNKAVMDSHLYLVENFTEDHKYDAFFIPEANVLFRSVKPVEHDSLFSGSQTL
jgi:hypothetical protein